MGENYKFDPSFLVGKLLQAENRILEAMAVSLGGITLFGGPVAQIGTVEYKPHAKFLLDAEGHALGCVWTQWEGPKANVLSKVYEAPLAEWWTHVPPNMVL